MNKLRISALIVTMIISMGSASWIRAQNATPAASEAPSPSDEEKQKEKEALEKKAVALLEQVITEVQALKLPENRIRVQIAAGDLLWKRNEAQARSMFSLATDGVAELMRNTDGNSRRWSFQLRQELVLAVARHDAPLAYQLVAATRPPSADANDNSGRGNPDAGLEQSLLVQIARLDPKFAAQKAEESLDKDQYPIALTRILAELQSKDKEAFNKLSQKVVSKLETANMLGNFDSGALALGLLQPGPRAPENPADGAAVLPPNGGQRLSPQILTPSAYTDLLGVVIDAALKATTPNATGRAANARGGGNARGRGPAFGGGFGPGGDANLSDAQIEQNNARRLLAGLQSLLPQVDQYAPARATAVRQKMTEVGVGNDPRANMAQFGSLMQQGTTDSLLAAAPAAPPQVQPRLYQQAALKALDEGNPDRARQIANDHLDARTRDSVLQRVEFKAIAEKAETESMDQLRQRLAQLGSDDERIDLLLIMANQAQKKDKKLTLRYLSEAQRLTNRRASNYRQFEQQISVADAFSTVEPARSFESLEPGIAQLNDMLSAAAVLNGFEVNVFRDGELPIDPSNSITNMVSRYGQELSSLSRLDFERAESSANKFQLPEARLIAKLSIVRSVLAPGGVFGGGFVNRFFAGPPNPVRQ